MKINYPPVPDLGRWESYLSPISRLRRYVTGLYQRFEQFRIQDRYAVRPGCISLERLRELSHKKAFTTREEGLHILGCYDCEMYLRRWRLVGGLHSLPPIEKDPDFPKPVYPKPYSRPH